jgi:hypothetical protein
MTNLQREFDRAVARENADPQGLPADILADMEADIMAHPEKYPAIHAAFAKMAAEKETKS